MEARVEDVEEAMKELWRFKSDAEKRIVAMETKMVVFAALAAALGSLLPSIVSAMFK